MCLTFWRALRLPLQDGGGDAPLPRLDDIQHLAGLDAMPFTHFSQPVFH